MIEYKWVAQDKGGHIYFYNEKPTPSKVTNAHSEADCEEGIYPHNHEKHEPIKSWKKRCFDLSKFDYEIIKGKLIGIPKSAPEWLMKIKEIDIKAFDWIARRKDIDAICKQASLQAYPFSWDDTKQGWDYWDNLYNELEDRLATANRHPYADFLIAHINDRSVGVEYRPKGNTCWLKYNAHQDDIEFRIKPQEK